MLWLLALNVDLIVVGNVSFGFWPCLTFARAYTSPLTKPTMIADTLPKVIGASKKMSPLMARGSLLRAPTIEYVVDEVTRTHHADEYEMKTVDRPEKIMAMKMLLRAAAGKFKEMFSAVQFSTTSEQTTRMGMERRLL
jgi:hypothetical protein